MIPPVVTGLAVDGDAVFWGAADGSIVRRSNGETTILGHAQPPIRGLAIDADTVYFTAGGTLFSVPRAGGTVKTIGAYGTNPEELLADAGVVYLLDETGIVPQGGLLRVEADGTATTLIGDLDWPSGLALDDTYVYVVAQAATVGGQVMKSPLLRVARTGGPMKVLATGAAYEFQGIAVDSARVYTLDQTDHPGALVTVPKDGGQPTKLAVLPYDLVPVAVAVDGTNAYVTCFIEPAEGRLLRVALDGSSQLEFADVVGVYFNAVRLNDKAVYWTTLVPYDRATAEGASLSKRCK